MNFRKVRARSKKNSITYNADSEKWRKTRSLRKSVVNYDELEEEEVEDEEIDNMEPIDWAAEFFGRQNSQCDDANDQDVEVQLTRKQTLILSTLLPDEILLLNKYDTGEPRRFVGVLMLADVSGYTALSERYNNTGKGGTYRLTVTLNTYLGALIEIIYSHGGDILKFAGDAFLALWKTDKKTFLYNTIHSVIACALLIQHLYAKYETDVKVNLKVKLAISAGNLIFSPIGVGNDMNYIVFGLPVLEAKLAESLCASGEVKLSPTAWAHCFSRNYDHVIDDNGHVTIKSILYDPQEKDVTKPFLGLGSIIRQMNKTFAAIENMPDKFWVPSDDMTVTDIVKKEEALSLRKTVMVAEDSNNGSQLRKFIIRPVLTQIDAHQPLEYLTEMRQVSILFLTLKPRECPPLQLITIVNNSYQITCEIVLKSMGCVNKIILFDKDIMTLVIFGLRGFKHDSEAQAALKCAYSIKKSISALDGVNEVSIGVTTGQVYCGVIGHPLRREFTVIGAIVNKAARLMCNFRNKITCDEVTFVKSKMSKNGFTLQPNVELKGIGQSGKIYEYSEEIRINTLNDIAMIPPLLDRIDEIEYYEHWFSNEKQTKRECDALLLIGESRIGKSRLLEWIARSARNSGRHVCYLNLTSIHSANPYLALSQIMNQVLGLEEPMRGFEKEEKIIDILKNYDDDLCYLNNIIKVRFAYHEGIQSLNEERRLEKTKKIFKKFILAIADTHLVCLDDLQNLDASSWTFISIMLEASNFYTVLTVNRSKFSNVHKWLYDVFISDNIRKIVLGSLSSVWIAPLACQILDVDAVPSDLVFALKTKCKGMPGLIESFIVHLFSTGAVALKKVTEEELELEEYQKENFHFPNPLQIKAQALDVKEQELLDEIIENEKTEGFKICLVTNKNELDTNINVQHTDVVIMIQIDALTPYQQLLLKIASVIGNILARDLLEAIMYENNPLITARAIKRLFAMRIFTCANVNAKSRRTTLLSNVPNAGNSNLSHLSCACRFDYDPENSDNLPKYAYCKVMKFRNKDSRKTCYELLPMNQKKEFHSRIVTYLENNPHKCTNCGGSLMIVQSFSCVPQTELEFIDRGPMNRMPVNIDKKDSVHSKSSSDDDNFDVTSRNSHKPNNSSRCPSRVSLRQTASESNVSRMRENTYIMNKSMPAFKSNVEEDNISQRSNRATLSSILFKDLQQFGAIEVNIFQMLRPVLEAETISQWRSLGVVDSQDDLRETGDGSDHGGPYSVKLEKGVSATDFNKCTCTDLNLTIHEQLIHHAKQAELTKKTIEISLQYVYLNLMINNTETALKCLEEIDEMCNRKQVHTIFTVFELKRCIARILALRSAANFLCGNILSAKIVVEQAARAYGYNLHDITEVIRLKKMLRAVRYKTKERRSQEQIMICDSLFCFNFATIIFCVLGDEKIARTCSYRALKILHSNQCTIVDMCESLTVALNLEIDRGYPENTLEIERVVSKTMRQLPRPVHASELYVVGKLLMATFRARMCRANLAAAIRAGFRAVVISHFLHANVITLDVIPDLFYALLSRRRIEEAIDVLKLTLLIGHDQDSYAYETWYYALCMDLILDAGFQLEAPYDIHRFCEYTLIKNSSDGAGRRRLVINMWTYWLRADNERRAKRFESEALHWAEANDEPVNFTSLMSALRLAEGMHECLVRKVDDLRKVVDMMELRSIADRELGRLEKDCRIMRTALSRWFILKGYSHMLSGRSQSAIGLFNQAIDEARRTNSHLAEALARAAFSNSRIWSQNARTGQFLDWQSGGEHALEMWHQLLYKVTPTARHR